MALPVGLGSKLTLMSGVLTIFSCLHRDDWPQAYWDDWMRLNKTRKGRQCIRPEVCRTYNFGEKGSSKGFYYKRFLAPIRLSAAELDWSKVDLSYLQQSRWPFTHLAATSCLSTQIATLGWCTCSPPFAAAVDRAARSSESDSAG